MSCLSTIPFVYGVKRAGNLRAELLLSDPQEVIREFREHRADLALVPAEAVPSLPGARPVTQYCVGAVPGAEEALAEGVDPLLDTWRTWGGLPFAFAVWVAREDTPSELVEELQEALTFGLEHAYEALLDSEYADDAAAAYEELMPFDYIFDIEKHQALRKFWDSGLKFTPRANPG